MNQLGVRGVPAMGKLRQTGTLKFSPGEMQKRPSVPVQTGARHTGGIDQRRSVALAQQVLTETGPALEGMVHVAKDDQISRSIPGHAIQSEG